MPRLLGWMGLPSWTTPCSVKWEDQWKREQKAIPSIGPVCETCNNLELRLEHYDHFRPPLTKDVLVSDLCNTAAPGCHACTPVLDSIVKAGNSSGVENNHLLLRLVTR